jgi:hypothetical protein
MDAFLKSIYFQESYLKAILFDSLKNEIRLCVSEISLGSFSQEGLGFDSERDIVDGEIVFSDVQAVQINAPNRLPNDEIFAITVSQPLSGSEYFEVVVDLGCVDKNSQHSEARLSLSAKNVYLVDPADPERKVR